MSIRSYARGLGAVACVALLAGCGSSSGGSSPTSSDTGAPATHSTSAAPTTTASASPTSKGTAAGAPGVPEQARQHTTAGAIAFAKYYVHLINDTGLHPKTGVLEPLALKGCKTCANYAGNVRSLARKGQHNSAKAAVLHSAHRIVGERGMAVEVMADQAAISVVDKDGRVANTYPLKQNVGLVFFLDWTHAGWRVHEIQIDESQMR